MGKNKKVPLRNNDEISLALPKNKGLQTVYHSLVCVEHL